jgi:peptidyl-prolyl cis-trans isomerase A (cyclophilin A)
MKRVLTVGLALAGCTAAPPRSPARIIAVPPPAPAEQPAAAAERRCTPAARPPLPIRPVAEVAPTPGDPLAGRFGMTEAVSGLEGSWPLRAVIVTSEGVLTCELWDQVAPRTVASFVGLARGLRPFDDPTTGTWRARRAYDGSTFHRVIPGFMIQGGDPKGTGTGEPGFMLPDEIDETVRADHRGLLYMANRGPNTNGMQFFILDGPAPHIDGRYTAFGECEPGETIASIAQAPRGAGDRPLTPVIIEQVRVELAGPCHDR